LSNVLVRERHTARQGIRFLAVGAAAYVIDVIVFNALAHGPGGAVLNDRPVTAKVVSTVVSVLASFYGNKLWTFEGHHHDQPLRQTTVFIGVNVVAWGLMIGPMALSRYALGLDGVVADNVSGNIIGVGLALVFRFWAYRRWVFPARVEA
jgi:putative flippase GtrA